MNFLSARSELKTAAMIGHKFKIDPVMVLNSDRFHWAVRVAALKHIQKIEEEEAKKIKKK